ncbi:unnamed protein product [Schistocephalus solidus]|uniref:Secreted protein n=1 Tax=Schistocephalus solidus TaxID=70667 RepID=A0A183SS87_SCHSO|nr:unnamed protein product [Schistocephalus solidus]
MFKYVSAYHHALAPAAAQRSSRTVIWSGPASYPGYKGSSQRSQVSQYRPPRPAYPPRVQRRPAYERNPTPRRVQYVPLRSQRAKDARYREGLHDLAGLM